MHRWGRVTTIGGLSTLLALTGISPPASAADPVRKVTVSKDHSIVLVEGLTEGDPITFEVHRNGRSIGSALGVVPAGGVYQLNHKVEGATGGTEDLPEEPTGDDPPDEAAEEETDTALCWTHTTPDLLGGDVVTVVSAGLVDEIVVSDIDVTQGPTKIDANTGVVRGRVGGDSRPPISELRVTTSGRTASDQRFDGRAPGVSDGVTGTLKYTSAGRFKATFDRLSPAQMGAFLDSEDVEAVHVSAEGLTGLSHSTVATYGADARFTEDLCPPVARRAVTDTSLGSINRGNINRPLEVRGVSTDADEVRVRIQDRKGNRRSQPATITGSGTSQTWSANFPEGGLRGLADGQLTVSAVYSESGTLLAGDDRTIRKDTVAPGGPRIRPRGGTFVGRERVRLAAPGARSIWYTLNGSRPGPHRGTAAEYQGEFTLGRSALLKVIALDAAGNASPVTSARFRRAGTPAAPRIGKAGSGAAGGTVTAIARWQPRVDTGGAPITGFAVSALRVEAGRVVARRTFTRPASARWFKAQLQRGQYRFQVRTVNRLGSSAPSGLSSRVTAR